MTNLKALRFYNQCWGSLPGPFLTKKRLSIEPKETTAFPDEGNRKGEPVSFLMICSASSSRRLICHVLSERLPARGAAQERHHKPNTLLSPALWGLQLLRAVPAHQTPGALPCTSSYFSRKRWSIAAISARVAVPCGSSTPSGFPWIRPLPTAHCIAALA